MQKNPVQLVSAHRAKCEENLMRRMVSPNEAARLFSVSPGTLGNWRSAKVGPKFYKVGNHKVLYDLADLQSYFTASPVLTIDSLPEAR